MFVEVIIIHIYFRPHLELKLKNMLKHTKNEKEKPRKKITHTAMFANTIWSNGSRGEQKRSEKCGVSLT